MKRCAAVLMGIGLFSLGLPIHGYALEMMADMVSKEGKITRSGKIYVKNDKCRIEKGMTPMYLIVRGDKALLWQVNGAEKTYVEAKLTPELKPGIEEDLPGEINRKDLGEENINGYGARKYEVTVKKGNKSETCYQWFAPEPDFPVKLSAKDGSWSVEYKNIKKGSVADEMFELPTDLTRDPLEVPDVLH